MWELSSEGGSLLPGDQPGPMPPACCWEQEVPQGDSAQGSKGQSQSQGQPSDSSASAQVQVQRGFHCQKAQGKKQRIPLPGVLPSRRDECAQNARVCNSRSPAVAASWQEAGPVR